MSRRFTVIFEKEEEGGYHVFCPTLPGCHTQARSLDELMERVKEAISLCLEERGRAPESLTFVGIQRVRVS